MATFMGYEAGSIPAVLTDKQASRLLAQHSLCWGDVRNAAKIEGCGYALALCMQQERNAIKRATLAAYLGY